MAGEKVLVVGYSWGEEGLSLEIRPWPEGEVRLLPLSGRFRFRKTGERRCIGWHDFEHHLRMPCPDKAVPEKSSCPACFEREGFGPWLRSDGYDLPNLKPSVQRYIEQPHYLYLACFGDPTVKVGMAGEQRRYKRLWEQGPLAAAYVAYAPDAVTIRRIEVQVSHLGYVESLRRSRKLELLTSGMNEAAARGRVMEAFKDVRARLPEEFRRHLFDEPRWAPRPPQAVKARDFLQLERLYPRPEQIVEGTVTAASGSILILDDKGVKQALDLADLESCVIELDPAGEARREVTQIGLF